MHSTAGRRLPSQAKGLRWLLFAAWLLLSAPALQAGQGAGAPDTIAQRVLPCAACHGEEGRATRDGYYPRIAGKPAGYLYSQLINFREGRRLNAQMTYMTQRQGDAYLRE
ncbi:MAG: c-type cytochrome, partial [Solimonas sp.]